MLEEISRTSLIRLKEKKEPYTQCVYILRCSLHEELYMYIYTCHTTDFDIKNDFKKKSLKQREREK